MQPSQQNTVFPLILWPHPPPASSAPQKSACSSAVCTQWEWVSVFALYYECVCIRVCVYKIVCYRPLICMSSIGSYINHTVIRATGHTEALPNQCWVNNSPLQIFLDFLSFVERPMHVCLKVRRKWVGFYSCSASQRSLITMEPNYRVSLGPFSSEKTDFSLTTVIRI